MEGLINLTLTIEINQFGLSRKDWQKLQGILKMSEQKTIDFKALDEFFNLSKRPLVGTESNIQRLGREEMHSMAEVKISG